MSPAMATREGCPDEIFNRDSGFFISHFLEYAGKLTRPVDIVNGDGEIFISLMSPAELLTWLEAVSRGSTDQRVYI